MRINKTSSGDFLVTDELPFHLRDIQIAQARIWTLQDVAVFEWPITIELNDKTGFWELWFIDPEGKYVEELLDLPELPASDG